MSRSSSASVEHGIEWLTTPKNMAWLKKELDDATDGVKELLSLGASR